MANGVEEAAEKAYRLAEERFLAGDLDAALRLSRNAKRQHSASFPALERALAAYEVHAAARGGGRSRDWHAVLGVRPPATRDAIKKQYKRMCLVLHPDKNRSVAADGAFKLLQQAWEALSTSTPPPPGGGHTPPAPATPPPDESDWWWSSSDAPPFDFGAWREAYARDNGNIYCGHCYAGGGAVRARGKSSAGDRCHSCGTPAPNRPPDSGEETESTAAPPPGRRSGGGEGGFTCPAVWPLCGTPFSSLVGVGRRTLRCQACTYDAVVHVYNRDVAIAF